MADNDVVDELTVEHRKRTVVENAFKRIRLLFDVLVNFSTPEESAVKSGIQWLALKGEKDSLNKAKFSSYEALKVSWNEAGSSQPNGLRKHAEAEADVKRVNIKSRKSLFHFKPEKEYIKSLCNPELVISVPFAEQFYNVLYDSRDDLERSTSAVVKFPSMKECLIQGSAEAVIMAQSAIEDRLKTPQTPAIEPQLREFAIKLGYSNQVIDQAVQKLDSNVTQNTLLNELLKQTASLPYQISATPSQPKPASGPVAPHFRQREVVARGAPNTSSIIRPGYENPPDHMVRAPFHPRWDKEPSPGPSMPYNRRDGITKGMPDPVSRLGFEMIGGVMERCAPRGTKRGLENQRPNDIVSRGCSSAHPLMNVVMGPYGNQVSPLYDSREVASSSCMTATEARLNEQEQLMYQQTDEAKKTSVSASSNLRPGVIDGSNVAMSTRSQLPSSGEIRYHINMSGEHASTGDHSAYIVGTPTPKPRIPSTAESRGASFRFPERRERLLVLPDGVLKAIRSQSCDAANVVAQMEESVQNLQLNPAALVDPTPETKHWIRCLAIKAKNENRMDIFTYLRSIAPAGTTGPLLAENLDVRLIPLKQRKALTVNLCGGDEWKVLAEKLGMSCDDIRFLDKRTLNPCDVALNLVGNSRHLSIGELYDILVECELAGAADLL